MIYQRSMQKVRALVLASASLAPVSVVADVNVLTYHNDDARSGVNRDERILSPARVGVATFGKLFARPVDGQIYAQPLYVSQLAIPRKGIHNVVFVATQSNSVYAFDADSNDGDNAAPLWRANFTDPGAGMTTVPFSDTRSDDIAPEVGITGTPTIDLASGTLYVVSKTKGPGRGYSHLLHALDIATGAEKFGGPVEIRASASGNGVGADGRGTVSLDPRRGLNRPGLALADGVVYLSFTAHGDRGQYHGWILGYDAHTLRQVHVFNTTPNGKSGGIWMGGAAPAVDPNGNIYVITGNGTFDPNPSRANFGNSFLRLSRQGRALVLRDYFTPHNQAALNASDLDLGGGGVLLLPDSMGGPTKRQLLIGCGKNSTLYLLDRADLGAHREANDDQIVQSLPGAIGPCYGKAVAFGNKIYLQAGGDPMRAFEVVDGRISPQPVSESKTRFGFPGSTPSISANGDRDAIVWVVRTDGYMDAEPAVLFAYDAEDLTHELYNSNLAGVRDLAGPAIKFTIPIVANGKVYVGSANALTVYGLLGEAK